MRTSEELYHRVRWDARFDPARFVVGILQRGAEPKRMPLSAFVPGGDIPWHRVIFFEADDEVVWDRSSGVDRIDETGAGRARDPRRLRAPFFTARTPYMWEGDGWIPAPAPGGRASTGLRVLTWNTLWDRYDGDRIDTALRRPLLLAALRDADADVIALQEVERALLDMLLREPWVRDGWTVATDPRGRDVDECGLLLLSRLPVREVGHLALGPHKAVTALVVETADGPVTVAATHLSSDHSENGADRRDAELSRLAEGLAGVEGDVVLVGDFNDGGDGPQSVLGMRDAWSDVHGPADRTPTFDPAANPLAAISSLSGRVSRLDRVLLRTDDLRAGRAVLHGDAPAAEGPFISDHYGVGVDLVRRDGGGALAAPATRTAEARTAPRKLRAAERHPEPATALHTPTAQPDPAAEPSTTPPSPNPTTAPHTPTAQPDAAWPDRTTPTAPHTPTAQPAAAGLDALGASLVARRIRHALPHAALHIVGSRRMDCALPHADLDLVAALLGTVDIADVRARVAAALPESTALREVVGARVPGLRLRVDGTDIDLVVVGTGAVAPDEAVDRRTELGEAAGIALSAVSDADAVLETVGPHREAFTRLAREVKAWAHARGLDSAPFGGLPGLAWSVLAAHTVREAGPLPPTDLLRHFFATWAAWDWREPVGGPGPGGLPVTIMTPTEPVRPCSGQVGPVGRELLTEELFHAWEKADAGLWPELLTPPPLHRRHAAWAVVTVPPGPDEGRVRGRMRALLTALEEAGATHLRAWPRPFTTDPVRYAVGLGTTPPTRARVAEIAQGWLRGLPGVTLTLAARGDVPPLR